MTGQVWSLELINNELFCGHDKGTFVVAKGKPSKIPGTQGSWTFKQNKTDDIVFEGNYFGLNVLQKIDGNWKIRNSLSGFDLSSRFFELTENNKIIVVHGYKGVYKLDLSLIHI